MRYTGHCARRRSALDCGLAPGGSLISRTASAELHRGYAPTGFATRMRLCPLQGTKMHGPHASPGRAMRARDCEEGARAIFERGERVSGAPTTLTTVNLCVEGLRQRVQPSAPKMARRGHGSCGTRCSECGLTAARRARGGLRQVVLGTAARSPALLWQPGARARCVASELVARRGAILTSRGLATVDARSLTSEHTQAQQKPRHGGALHLRRQRACDGTRFSPSKRLPCALSSCDRPLFHCWSAVPRATLRLC